MRNFVFVILLSVPGFSGCEEKASYAPSEEEQQLIKAYAALLVLHERFGPTSNPDSVHLYHQSLDSILLSYDLTRDKFRQQFEDLADSPERFKPLLQEISTILQKGIERR